MHVDRRSQTLIDRAKRAPRLSLLEEREHFEAWRDRGDRQAAARLIEANLRHVVFTALEYKRYGIPVDDLISEGNVGLMKAFERYDPGRNVRFATYATYWIRAQIVLSVMDSWTLLSGPRGALDSRVFFRLRRERARLVARGQGLEREGEPSLTAQLALQFGVSERRMEEMLGQLDGRGVSLDVGPDAHESPPLPQLRSDADQAAHVERHEQALQLERILGGVRGQLDPREAFILDRRLMADPDERLSLGEIGAHFGVSRERVRQIEVRTQKKLKAQAQLEDMVDATQAA